MKSNFFDFFCCSKPPPIITFQHTKIEFMNSYAYIDLFCYTERTFIMDSDYLCIVCNQNKEKKKIPRMREPGNFSGVARVTFPKDFGMYFVNYVRKEGNREIILAETSIFVPNIKDPVNTFDTENYSPKFLNNIRNNFSVFVLKDSILNNEPTNSIDLTRLE